MALQWIEHRGQRILSVDFRNLTEDQMIAQLNEELSTLQSEPRKSRLLVNVTDAATGQRFMAAAKALGKQIDALVEKQAIVGVDGLKTILLRAYNAVSGGTLKPFDTETLALEYLARQ
jgi:hypothetical protein